MQDQSDWYVLDIGMNCWFSGLSLFIYHHSKCSAVWYPGPPSWLPPQAASWLFWHTSSSQCFRVGTCRSGQGAEPRNAWCGGNRTILNPQTSGSCTSVIYTSPYTMMIYLFITQLWRSFILHNCFQYCLNWSYQGVNIEFWVHEACTLSLIVAFPPQNWLWSFKCGLTSAEESNFLILGLGKVNVLIQPKIILIFSVRPRLIFCFLSMLTLSLKRYSEVLL